MQREYYYSTIRSFVDESVDEILGKLTRNSTFSVEQAQRDAWLQQIDLLKKVLETYDGSIFFEYSIPRMGKRIDVLLVIKSVVFVLEFKVGEKEFTTYAEDQVFDYALDLKNFHKTSHDVLVAPVLVATKHTGEYTSVATTPQNDKLLFPVKCGASSLASVVRGVLDFSDGTEINLTDWRNGRYSPTPTIVEAARALYAGHSVADISRSDAGATNLTETADALSEIIKVAKEKKRKSICFVTGVPGAGKTLVGLNIANEHSDESSDLYSVFLSGNAPLVAILQEALARDKVQRDKENGIKTKKGEALSAVKVRIQNVHHFRDECLRDPGPPKEHVALFDEAQRAWHQEKTVDFMTRKKGRPDFKTSEPEFLISCLDRHEDWAVVVCLVGGGQEIHTGEAGIGEWIASLKRSFPDWHVHISSRIHDSEYGVARMFADMRGRDNIDFNDKLHLSVSMRSFRAEEVSLLVKQILDIELDKARATLGRLSQKYPIVITRDLAIAKNWLRRNARGSERYGLVVSSQAERLKPHAIDVRSPMDPVHWFLDGKEDVRSSYYLEDVATEFDVQGLELDWACVTWDGDFRFDEDAWLHKSFQGSKWNNINKEERRIYQKNAYRVLLTRARQGMVIVVPRGDVEDPTRSPEIYDGTFNYLASIGFEQL